MIDLVRTVKNPTEDAVFRNLIKRQTTKRFFALMFVVGIFVAVVSFVNLPSVKLGQMSLFGLTLTFSVGAFAYGLTFPCTDLLSELWGKKVAQLAVTLGFIGSALACLCVSLAIWIKPAEIYGDQEAFATIFGGVISTSLGCFVSYAVSQYFDVWAFHKIKPYTGNSLAARAFTSTAASQLIDSFLFITVAFGFNGKVILSQWALKVFITACCIPVILTLRRIIGYSGRYGVSDEHLAREELGAIEDSDSVAVRAATATN